MPVQSIDRERILVCVSASPTSSDVIRRAAKLSESLGAELIALYVENSEIQNDAQEKAVHEHLDLAQRQGAILTTIYGDDPATAIAQYARVSGITYCDPSVAVEPVRFTNFSDSSLGSLRLTAA